MSSNRKVAATGIGSLMPVDSMREVVETIFLGESCDFFEQVFAQGAADTAIRHLDKLFLSAIECSTAGYEGGVDVDLAHIVDDHGHALAFAVGEHVVEQSGLAGAKEAGQNGHRKTFTHEVTLARNENRS